MDSSKIAREDVQLGKIKKVEDRPARLNQRCNSNRSVMLRLSKIAGH